jgi:hypothetical protein
MNHKVTYVHGSRRIDTNLSIARQTSIAGGAKTGAAKALAQDPRQSVVFFDVERDLKGCRRLFGHLPNVKFITIGKNLTTYALAANANATVRDAIYQTANTSLSEGAGARAMIAQLAAEELLASEDYCELLASYRDEILLQTEGSPSLAVAQHYFSVAGAVGTALSLFHAKQIARVVSTLNIPCQQFFHAIGPLTFTGVSDRACENAASNTASLVDYALSNEANDASTAKIIYLHELPLCGHDMEKRGNLVTLDYLAKSGAQTEDRLAISRPNDALTSKVGSIYSCDADFFPPLDREKDMAGSVAEAFHQDFSDALKAAVVDASIVKEVDYKTESIEPNRQQDLRAVLANARNEAVDVTMQAVERTQFRLRHRVELSATVGKSTSTFVPENIDLTVSEFPEDVKSFVAKQETYAAFEKALAREASIFIHQMTLLKKQLESESASLNKMLVWTKRRRGRKLPAAAVTIATSVRANSEKCKELQSKFSAVQRAIGAVKRELEFLQASSQSILSTLDQFRRRDSFSDHNQLFIVDRIDIRFAELQYLATLPRSQQVDLLCRSAGLVSRHGLAKIVGISSNRVEDIAKAIQRATYPIESPSHGGQSRSNSGRPYYKLPPTDVDTEAKLVAAIKARDEQSIVEFYDDLTHGACISRVTIRQFKDLQSIFPRPIASALKKSMTDQLSVLNSIDQFACVERLGGKIEGDVVVFHNPTPTQKTDASVKDVASQPCNDSSSSDS